MPDDYEAWERFLKFHRGQIGELCDNYDPALLWFDGDWERSAEQWRMDELRDFIHSKTPNCVLNSRMMGHGDYETPEQGIPIHPPKGQWEFCMTINDSWGWQANDFNWKSSRQIIRIFCEILGMGGKLLLDIGPKANGSIVPEQVDCLKTLGAWIKRNSEAVLGTVAGLPSAHFYGPTSLSEDKQTLYLYYFDIPREQLSVKGIRNDIKRISVLGKDETLTHKKLGGFEWRRIPGILWIDLPESQIDEYATVVKIELDGPLDLYEGQGAGIDVN